MVSTYDTTITSLIINYSATSDFCQHGMHDTTYDTTIWASLNKYSLRSHIVCVLAFEEFSLLVCVVMLSSKYAPRLVTPCIKFFHKTLNFVLLD